MTDKTLADAYDAAFAALGAARAAIDADYDAAIAAIDADYDAAIDAARAARTREKRND